ncbi:MAG TPA: preprotein translocase subunit SecY [Candidatus Paceibacterota bacterium]|jgi:preprotein translocase subunit SecY|nr:preprotein translocase subunit SecY [Parcubacteria group bacterium]HOM33128.1 preprotein translocase subunit SecY [Candidatus Paceibacterota bacterium]HPC37339.1 preprotein translocase subunit SecY [Candidatus Paceibacterota bacterium]HRU35813.1 preprotein translocase subunit SecY [Candidatus Paceibacterota bacterium]
MSTFTKIFQIFKIKDLRKKILMVLLILVIFRLFANLPIPGIDLARLKAIFASNQLLGILNIFSGGTMERLSVMMLGVGPYITATIIMQLLTMVVPRLKEIYYEEGEKGRAKFNQWSRYLSIPLCLLQAYAFLNLLSSQQVIPQLDPLNLIRNVLVITAGSVFLMWLGELITEYKVGNGISLIIFAGIVSSWPSTIRSAILSYTPSMLPTYLMFLAVALIVIAGVVYINEAERKIPITYAKRVRGNKMYGGVSSYLPLKVNQAGVIPIIFAISILLFPQFLGQLLITVKTSWAMSAGNFLMNMFNNQIIYTIVYFVLVVLFTYFYTMVTFDPKEISTNLQRNGGFIPGIRPGQLTGNYIKYILNRITFIGALFLGIIAILPNILQAFTGSQFLTIGGTSILIVVAVAIETIKQIEAQLVMREYEGF